MGHFGALERVISVPHDAVQVREEKDVPAEYAKLLCHKGNLTPALEAHFQEKALIQVKGMKVVQIPQTGEGAAADAAAAAEERVERTVVLVGQESAKVFSLGCIDIHLGVVEPSSARDQILEGRIPLGTILREHQIMQSSRPKCFFAVRMWDDLVKLMGTGEIGAETFGRCNVLVMDDGRVLADVLEVIAPIETARL